MIWRRFVKVLLLRKMLEVILYLLYAVLLGVLGVAIWRLRYGLRHFKMKRLMTVAKVVEKLPSVTVCIPARNETHAMTDCLQSVISNTYPKLEVIVLDDVSRDNTSSLIKAFAQDGIRFVEGAALPEGWLGKNHALHELAQEASGTYLLFMDVDTRLQPDSIEQLVAYAEQENADMVSVLPRREDGWRTSVLMAPLRYFWEVIFHRREAPASSSNAWMIRREVLRDQFGGFQQFKMIVQPEAKLSAALMAKNRYRVLIGTKLLGITYEKKWSSQVETSVRLLFPLLGANPLHAMIAVLDLLVIAAPLFVVLSGFLAGWGIHQVLSGLLLLAFAALYGTYLSRVRGGKTWLVGALLWPVIVLQEAVLITVSTIQYLRHRVTWKGRLVRSRQ
jgi:glycosyltransferase involved in cell wall biosynthesis